METARLTFRRYSTALFLGNEAMYMWTALSTFFKIISNSFRVDTDCITEVVQMFTDPVSGDEAVLTTEFQTVWRSLLIMFQGYAAVLK
jgi:hypothetical protein